MGDALTAALFTHSVLTEGDWIQVLVGGVSYDLRVLELRPDRAVSVIGGWPLVLVFEVRRSEEYTLEA